MNGEGSWQGITLTRWLALARVLRIFFRNLGGRGFREFRVEIWADLADGRFSRKIRRSISASDRRLHTLPPQYGSRSLEERKVGGSHGLCPHMHICCVRPCEWVFSKVNTMFGEDQLSVLAD